MVDLKLNQHAISAGFAETGGCIDLNECVMGTHECGSTQICINIPGSYICECQRKNDGFVRRGKECFVHEFYEHNEAAFNSLGRGGKPSWLSGIGRQWDLPIQQAQSDYSAGMIQFLVNHLFPEGTKWDKFTISSPPSGKSTTSALLHTAIYSKSFQNTPDLGPWQCSFDVCHECLDGGKQLEKQNPNDGGGERLMNVIRETDGEWSFRAAASTSMVSFLLYQYHQYSVTNEVM